MYRQQLSSYSAPALQFDLKSPEMPTVRRCNLCLRRAVMTQDHLFPKALARPGQRKVTKILHPVDPSRRGRQGTFLAQNGVTKATLCADCNNRVLGTELDPSLIETYKAALSALELCRFPVIPDLHLIGVNLNKVARSVAGHLLALTTHRALAMSWRDNYGDLSSIRKQAFTRHCDFRCGSIRSCAKEC